MLPHPLVVMNLFGCLLSDNENHVQLLLDVQKLEEIILLLHITKRHLERPRTSGSKYNAL